jgi:hypothetical protein
LISLEYIATPTESRSTHNDRVSFYGNSATLSREFYHKTPRERVGPKH